MRSEQLKVNLSRYHRSVASSFSLRALSMLLLLLLLLNSMNFHRSARLGFRLVNFERRQRRPRRKSVFVRHDLR